MGPAYLIAREMAAERRTNLMINTMLLFIVGGVRAGLGIDAGGIVLDCVQLVVKLGKMLIRFILTLGKLNFTDQFSPVRLSVLS